MYYPLLIDSNLIDEVDGDHANDSNRHNRSEGFSMIDNNISSDDSIIISSQEKDNPIEIYQVNNNNDINDSNNDNNDKNNYNNKYIINNNADNDENIHDDDHNDGSFYNDGRSDVPSRSVYLDDSYDRHHHHHNELSDLINYDTTTTNSSSIVDIDVYNNNINTNNILPLSIVNDSCHSITNDASKGDANIVDVSHSQDPISIDCLTTLLSFHDHNGDHGDNGITCDDSEVMKDHFIDMKKDGITSPLIALKTHIPPPLNIHSSSVSSSSSSMKEDDVSAQSQWMDDSPTTVKIKTIVGQEVGRLLGDDSKGSMNLHLHGHGIEDRDDDDGYDDHDVIGHENDQLTKGADDNHDVPSSTKQMTVNKPIISFYVKDYSINNTSTMIDRCMDTDETELSLYTSSSNWWNKIHPSSSSSSSSSSHHNHEEKPQQQQNKNNNSSSSSNANDKYKIGHRHPSQYENNSNAKDNLTYKVLYKSAIIHDRIRAISDCKYGDEASDSINNDYNNNGIALRLIANKYPGKQKRFIDSETDRISKIMMGVFQKPF